MMVHPLGTVNVYTNTSSQSIQKLSRHFRVVDWPTDRHVAVPGGHAAGVATTPHVTHTHTLHRHTHSQTHTYTPSFTTWGPLQGATQLKALTCTRDKRVKCPSPSGCSSSGYRGGPIWRTGSRLTRRRRRHGGTTGGGCCHTHSDWQLCLVVCPGSMFMFLVHLSADVKVRTCCGWCAARREAGT